MSPPQSDPRELERLTLIAQITNPVVGAGPLPRQVQGLLDRVRAAYAVDACVVRTLEGRELSLLAAIGVPDSQLLATISAEEGLARRMIEERRPLSVSNVDTEATTADLATRARLSDSFFRFRSYAGAPLLVENSVVGILGIYTTQHERLFTESELNHLQIVANHIAISIVNDRLYRALVANREELRLQIEQRERAEAERQAIELQLRHAQRMESLGQLAGGIAHDFNNLLTVILGGVDGLRASAATQSDPQAREWLEHIDEAGQRATDLTRQLLAFSRKQPNNPQVFDLSALVRRMHKILRRLLPEQIGLSLDCVETACPIRADLGHIEQVIVNLVVNARDAIDGEGHIEVGCACGPVDAAPPDVADPGCPRPWALLWIRDDGSGMDAETVSRIFEPFFTTKPHGAGTGLGLAMVYGIVKQAGGIVTVDTAPGQGATFRLYFPLIAEEGAAERRAQQHAPSPGGTELVLVCEDEPSVRLVMATTLRSAGYRVLEAESAEAALELVAAMPEPLDALVTDMVMPGMNGRQLAERLRLKYPALACLLVSGYLGHGDQAGSSGGDGLPQLQKPFTPQTLLARVRQLIRNRA